MSSPFLPYYVTRRGNGFAVYRWADETKRQATRQEVLPDYPTARARAHALNGEYLRRRRASKPLGNG